MLIVLVFKTVKATNLIIYTFGIICFDFLVAVFLVYYRCFFPTQSYNIICTLPVVYFHKCSCGIRCADHMSTQYRLVQSGKTASGGCSAGQVSLEPVAPRIYFIFVRHSYCESGLKQKRHASKMLT
jgi:hypothetical protein